jgi:hypothetical protein
MIFNELIWSDKHSNPVLIVIIQYLSVARPRSNRPPNSEFHCLQRPKALSSHLLIFYLFLTFSSSQLPIFYSFSIRIPTSQFQSFRIPKSEFHFPLSFILLPFSFILPDVFSEQKRPKKGLSI